MKNPLQDYINKNSGDSRFLGTKPYNTELSQAKKTIIESLHKNTENSTNKTTPCAQALKNLANQRFQYGFFERFRGDAERAVLKMLHNQLVPETKDSSQESFIDLIKRHKSTIALVAVIALTFSFYTSPWSPFPFVQNFLIGFKDYLHTTGTLSAWLVFLLTTTFFIALGYMITQKIASNKSISTIQSGILYLALCGVFLAFSPWSHLYFVNFLLHNISLFLNIQEITSWLMLCCFISILVFVIYKLCNTNEDVDFSNNPVARSWHGSKIFFEWFYNSGKIKPKIMTIYGFFFFGTLIDLYTPWMRWHNLNVSLMHKLFNLDSVSFWISAMITAFVVGQIALLVCNLFEHRKEWFENIKQLNAETGLKIVGFTGLIICFTLIEMQMPYVVSHLGTWVLFNLITYNVKPVILLLDIVSDPEKSFIGSTFNLIYAITHTLLYGFMSPFSDSAYTQFKKNIKSLWETIVDGFFDTFKFIIHDILIAMIHVISCGILSSMSLLAGVHWEHFAIEVDVVFIKIQNTIKGIILSLSNTTKKHGWMGVSIIFLIIGFTSLAKLPTIGLIAFLAHGSIAAQIFDVGLIVSAGCITAVNLEAASGFQKGQRPTPPPQMARHRHQGPMEPITNISIAGSHTWIYKHVEQDKQEESELSHNMCQGKYSFEPLEYICKAKSGFRLQA